MNKIEETALQNQLDAAQVIKESGIIAAWESIGAKVNPVGSLAMGLLMKHLDIDFHIYTTVLDIKESFKAIGKICSSSSVTRMEFRNLADTSEACFEWHIWYMYKGKQWQIDMIQILEGSEFDGYFEHVAQRINAVMTPEMRKTILELKFQTPDDAHIMGIEYYQAVIADGVRTYPEFTAWRKTHPVNGIIRWCP